MDCLSLVFFTLPPAFAAAVCCWTFEDAFASPVGRGLVEAVWSTKAEGLSLLDPLEAGAAFAGTAGVV